MRLLVNVFLRRGLDGSFYIDLFGDSAQDTVGPLDLESGLGQQAVLEIPEPPPPRGISTRLRKAARRAEVEVASDIGGRRQPGSGNQPGAKGDVRLRGAHRIEQKVTTSKSYRVTLKDLNKIRAEAQGKEKPAFIIKFLNPQLRQEDRWVLVPYEDWYEAHVDHGPGLRGS